MWLGVVGGLRWSEYAGLTVANLDLLGGTVSVSQQLGRSRLIEPTKTAASQRRLAIPVWLVDQLAALLARRGLTAADADALVFVDPRGLPLNYVGWREEGGGSLPVAGLGSRPYGSTTYGLCRQPPSSLPASTSKRLKPGSVTPARQSP